MTPPLNCVSLGPVLKTMPARIAALTVSALALRVVKLPLLAESTQLPERRVIASETKEAGNVAVVFVVP